MPTDDDARGRSGGTRTIAHEVAEASLRAYRALPRSGKPNTNETTVLAAFAISRGDIATNEAGASARIDVIALGTGTKCLSHGQRSAAGDAIHDSHAEVRRSVRAVRSHTADYALTQVWALHDRIAQVVARRALLRWLYAQIREVLNPSLTSPPESVVFERRPDHHCWAGDGSDDAKRHDPRDWRAHANALRPKAGVKFHFFATHPPCGDASVFAQDPQASPCTALGCVHRKPGRGDPTSSMSCSDKIAKWLALGVQGAFLSIFLSEPLPLASLTILVDPYQPKYTQRGMDERAVVAAAEDAALRAFWGRWSGAPRVGFPPTIHVISARGMGLEAQGLALDAKDRPSRSGVAINWSAMARIDGDLPSCPPAHEVTLSGAHPSLPRLALSRESK